MLITTIIITAAIIIVINAIQTARGYKISYNKVERYITARFPYTATRFTRTQRTKENKGSHRESHQPYTWQSPPYETCLPIPICFPPTNSPNISHLQFTHRAT